MKKQNLVYILLATTISALISTIGLADVIWNPDSDYGQYQSYGNFFDSQSQLVTRSGGNAWATIGGAAGIVQFETMGHKSQLILQGTANASYRLVSDLGAGEVLTKFETIDARVGIGYDVKYNDTWRVAAIWTHESGHISDDINATEPGGKSLIGPDVGNEVVDFRIIHDIDRKWRLGAGIKPYFKSHPSMMFLWGEQFAEYFPYGVTNDIHHFKPFAAGSVQEGGVDHMDLTFNVQVGFAAADHFREGHTQGMRYMIGYYDGLDPRMKFLQYRHATGAWMYLGGAFEL